MNTAPNSDQIISFFKELQTDIIKQLEECDGKEKFISDIWEREGGGGGITRVINNGNILEKGGVNFSAVHGKLPAFIAKESKTGKAETFLATGVSIVIHPNNPHVPIIHMNVRYFEMNDGTWWFGGGIDLTPHYIIPDDVTFFHNVLKEVCDPFNTDFYPRFKKWADNYFLIKHRNETRGIGGIFFDHLTEEKEGMSKAHLFEFIKAVGRSFAPTYIALVNKYRNLSYTNEEKQWQYLRRGRYVEFNLVYDRGTKFGLETNGRIESILMSLPTNAGWVYDFKPTPGSREEFTLKYLSTGDC